MLGKQYRLKTKEVNYLLKRRQVISTPELLFFWVAQYSNKSYNQFAIQLSTKLHKRAVRRNKVKRMYYDLIQNKNLVSTPGSIGFGKFIGIPHKKNIENRHKLLDNKDWISIQYKLDQSLSIALKKMR